MRWRRRLDNGMLFYFLSLLSDLIANVVPLLLTEDTNALFLLRSASRFYCWLWKSVRASTFHWNVQFMAWLTLAIRPIFACLWVFGGCWYCDVIDRGDDAYPCFWFSIWTKTLYNKQWLMFWGSWYIRMLSNEITIMHYELMGVKWKEFVFALDILFVFMMYKTLRHIVAWLIILRI